jgi:UMP-CMP kinase
VPNVGAVKKPTVVFVLGGPGAGKGTNCLRAQDELGYRHLSAGDLLRAERQRPGSEVGQMIDTYIKEGKIVPVEVTVQLLKTAMEDAGWAGGNFLIDGFPRNADNLQGWAKLMTGIVNVAAVLDFQCPDVVMEARLLERGKTSGRSDDNIESIRKRFRTFKEETQPIIDQYAKEGLHRAVNTDRAEDAVWGDVKKVLMEVKA